MVLCPHLCYMRCMRKHLVVIACLLILLLPASASNMQKVYTARDAVYQRVERLCRIAGVSGPSSFSPLSARGLEMALERIDRSSLSDADRAEYDRLSAEIIGGSGSLIDADGFAMDLDVGINVGVNIADYSDFDWSNSDGIAPDRRYDALLQYRFEEPAISIHPGFYFGDHVYMDGDFALQNNNHHMYESTFGWLITGYDGHASIFGSNGPTSPPGELPLRAGLSAGSDHVSFIIGRYPHSIGSGVTGNLVVGDNFVYQEVAALSFMSRYFTYNISVTRFDQMESRGEGSLITDISRNEFTGPQQYRVIHRFDVPVTDRGKVSLNLGTIYNSSFGFDLRFFYPFVLGHNYYNYDNSTVKRPFDEANNILSLSTEWALGQGFSIYGEIVLDQAQMPWENKASVPSAYGVLLNLKHSSRIGSGVLDSWIEGVYTNPYLYLNQKVDEDGTYDFNLDYIVGYELSTLADYGYSGYQYGPDSIVISLGSRYYHDGGLWDAGGSLLYRIRGMKHLSHGYNGLYDTSIDMSDAVIGDDFTGVMTPSGGWKRAEHLIQLKACGSYLFEDAGIRLYGLVGMNVYLNYRNEDGRSHVSPMATIGFTWHL